MNSLVILLWVAIAIVMWILIYKPNYRLIRNSDLNFIKDFDVAEDGLSTISSNNANIFKTSISENKYWLLFFIGLLGATVILYPIIPMKMIVPFAVLSAILVPFHFQYRQRTRFKQRLLLDVSKYMSYLVRAKNEGKQAIAALNNFSTDKTITEPLRASINEVLLSVQAGVSIEDAIRTWNSKLSNVPYLVLFNEQVIVWNQSQNEDDSKLTTTLNEIHLEFSSVLTKQQTTTNKIMKLQQFIYWFTCASIIVSSLILPLLADQLNYTFLNEPLYQIIVVIIYTLNFGLLYKSEQVINKDVI